ncbi:hypothetical protein AMS68_000062 [Peltaster fructicola]|uniref:Enoyl reductase (ER) domain-containing protein n=1 Tax=Peltaster fructicola TaxID=286661 RepID=A0A6H0XIU0_9PEZI|nr:hypothetical protein AMS68_000062 [Peltaster fructicola]
MSQELKARAIVSRAELDKGGWKLEDVALRQPGKGELLVEMVGSGVCHTDVLVGGLPGEGSPIGFYPRVLGHEGSGYVKAVGPDVTVAKVGDPVLLSFDFCKACTMCNGGHYSHCDDFMKVNFGPWPVFTTDDKHEKPEISGRFFGMSSFASLSIVNETSVVNAKDLVKDKNELALFSPLGCGIQTGSGSVINAAKATADDTVCVLGLGGVGLSALMGAKVQGCKKVIGVDRVESRLQLARELGAMHVIDGSKLGDKSLADAIKEAADGEGPTVTIETTGAPPLIKAAIEASRNKGKVIQVGSAPFDFNLDINVFSFMARGIQYIGAIEGHAYPAEYVPKMVQWYREGKFPLDKFTKLFPADQFEEAIHEMHDGSTIKPILLW